MFDFNAYHEAKTLPEAFSFLTKHENARLIAGGTDLLVKMRDRSPAYLGLTLIGITRIPELSDITLLPDGTLRIGASNAFSAIENHPLVQKHAPLLSYAVSTVGGPQTRNAGTIGGNVCNGATSADSAPTLFAYHALLEIHNPDGVRHVPIADFYQGPGKVALGKTDILAAILIKKEDYTGYLGHYIKFAQRNAMDIANLSCAVLMKESDGMIHDLRICFGVAAPTPVRMKTAEAFARGKPISDVLLNEIGEKCLEDTRTRDSWRASKEYRDHLVKILPARCIRAILEEESKL